MRFHNFRIILINKIIIACLSEFFNDIFKIMIIKFQIFLQENQNGNDNANFSTTISNVEE